MVVWSGMHLRSRSALLGVVVGTAMLACPMARAAEHVTLRNGFEMDCDHREVVDGHTRLYLRPAAGRQTDSSANFVEVAADAVVHVEMLPDPPATPPVPPAVAGNAVQAVISRQLSRAEMEPMLAHAGVTHRIDADLLASVVRAESGGQVTAISRTGARGLMQLMPGTATEMGVVDAFRPEQNIDGGTAYLDHLLIRYHDNVALALAAYNAGPAAVDRYHGVPPYRETRAYVARVIREFNRRKMAELVASRSR